jgi:hypothetical protein
MGELATIMEDTTMPDLGEPAMAVSGESAGQLFFCKLEKGGQWN